MLEFADKYILLLANTLFNHKQSRISTWNSPNGLIHNQIDYIITPQRIKSSISRRSTRTYPGADINSDYDLVLCNIKFKLSIKKRTKGNRIRFDLENLNNQTTIESYRNILQTELNNLDMLNKSPTTIYKMVETSIISAASETIGKHRAKKKASEIYSLRFADVINLISGSNVELQQLTNSL